MKRLAVLLAFGSLIVAWAYSQSLADLANKEKERRKDAGDAKVITNAEAAKYKGGPVSTFSIPDKPAPKGEPGQDEREADEQASATEADPDEPVDFQGRPESYWRKTMTDARQKVKDLENEANVIMLKLNQLQMDFYREDDGFKREGIQREIQKAIYEQDLNKENLAKAKDALQDLEKEARKSGALPGWVD